MEIIFLLLLFASISVATDLYKNTKLNGWEEIEGEDKDDVNCEENKDTIQYLFDNMQKKRNSQRHTLSEITEDNPLFSFFPAHHQSHQHACSCGRVNRLVDLGVNYFPRYVSDMTCLQGGCGNYNCKPKRFKLWVMRKRHTSDLEPGTEPVPVDLRENWIGESIVTTVDCECAP